MDDSGSGSGGLDVGLRDEARGGALGLGFLRGGEGIGRDLRCLALAGGD